MESIRERQALQQAIDPQIAQAGAERATQQDARATAVLGNQAGDAQATQANAERSGAGEFWRKHKRTAGIVGAGAGIIALAVSCDRADTGARPVAAAVDTSKDICADPSMDNKLTESLGKEAGDFKKTAFLPRSIFDSDKEVEDQVLGTKGWFKTSPLGTTIDGHSIAAVNAVITEPATDGKAAITDGAEFITNYEKNLPKLTDTDAGREFAEQLCENTLDVMRSDAHYNANWAEKGDVVVRIEATRDQDGNPNDIDCMTLVEVAADHALKGMELRPTKDEEDGYTSVLITENGDMYIKGIAMPRVHETPQQATTSTGNRTRGTTGGNGNRNGGNAGGGGGDHGGDSGHGGGSGGDCDGSCGGGGGGGHENHDNDDHGDHDNDDNGGCDDDCGGGDDHEPEKKGDTGDGGDKHDDNID